MKKTKFSHKVMAIFLTLTFLPSVMPINYLYASNNGPNAPEAASFEPVDATDMVNLTTGDLSYVMPLLNVPSPEGGYPLALSYHAGIAMDQEASWVGLGWSLNPGALNRSVNGLPDDWGKTNVSEFFRNTGWTETEYDVSVGATVYGATVGLGASWGTNKAFGGEIMIGAGGFVGKMGSNGSIGLTIGGNTQLSVQGSTASIGVQAGMYGASLGHTLSYDTSTRQVSNTISLGGSYGKLSSGTNINFSSSGSSISSQNSIGGISLSNSTGSVSNGDYFTQHKTKGIDINALGQFWFKYTKTEIKYSLFKTNNLSVAGSLYPNHSKKVNDLKVDTGHFMDIKETFGYNDYEILGRPTTIAGSEIELPNYDNYSVSAQGLSGNIKPSIFQELTLFGRGEKPEETDVIWTEYLSDPSNATDFDYDNNVGTHFYMDNSISSFLRIDRTKMLKPSNVSSMNEVNALSFYTNSTGLYNENVTPDSNIIKSGNRMREGNYIETFTNDDIRNNAVSGGFLETKDLDRSDVNTFVEEGIGAFQITALDGKVYHYSLPVYHFEEYSKVYNEENKEEENFLESFKTKPYATHWLLTAITGPDYLKSDINRDYPDEGDYGYWVRFDYGKWSDGFGWRTPKDGSNINYIPGKENYSYAWGRKQVYYLDAIKTRTHTALFVKNIRDDNRSSSNLNTYNENWSPSSGDNFNYVVNPLNYEDENQFKKFAQPGETFYDINNNEITLASNANGFTLRDFTAKKTVLKYLDIPTSSSLKLEKIFLLKNEDASVSKSSGTLSNILSGSVYLNHSYSNIQAKQVGSGVPYFLGNVDLFANPNNLISFETNIHTNVLDVADIVGTDLQAKSLKVIDFNYDASYPLAKNTPNSVAIDGGRLTLNAVYSQGKGGANLIPPYKFEYGKHFVNYDKSLQDVWGYPKGHPDAWSLNKIITPQGSNINITYESDEFKSAQSRPLQFGMDPRPNDDTDLSTGRLLTIPDSNGEFDVDAREYFGMKVGDTFEIDYFYYANNPCNPLQGCDPLNDAIYFKEQAQIVQSTSGTKFLARLNNGGTNHSVGNRHLRSLTATYPIKRTTAEDNYVGGGIRVKQIDVKEGSQIKYRTDYEYEGGVTSYIPLDDYQVSYASEIISPGVLYKLITAKSINQTGDLIQKTRYEFEVPETEFELIEVETDQDYYFTTTNNSSTSASKTTFHDKSAYIGRLKSVSHFNPVGHQNGDGQLLQKTIHNYKSDHSLDGSLGMRQESYKSYKKKTYPEQFDGARNNTWDVRAISVVKYPNVLQSKTMVENNETKTMHYDKFDYLTGQVISTRSVDSKGRTLKSEIRPAYHKYAGMGAKVDGLNNSNMLTQKRMDLLSISDDGANYAPIATGINTWKQWENSIWRSHESYRWIGQKTADGKFIDFDISNDDGFVWSNPVNSSSSWQRTSEITKYNSFSRAIEVMDINENRASTKLGDNDSQVFAVANASYDEMFYSGAEDLNGNLLSGGVTKGSASPTADAHTGKSALIVGSGQTAFEVTVKNNMTTAQTDGEVKKFKISLWAKIAGNNYLNTKVMVGTQEAQLNTDEIVKAGEWAQLNFYSPIEGTKEVHVTTSSGNIIIDDFRLHPVHSTMTSYVYNEWRELTHIIGANNMAIEYKYDSMGRLKSTNTEVADFNGDETGGFKPNSENQYSYKYQ